MSAKTFIKRVAAKLSRDDSRNITGQQKYDYSDREAREATVPFLYAYAKSQKEEQTAKFKLYDDYYNNEHITQKEIAKFCENKGLPFIPAIIPDAYIHVESQIIPELPDFEFNGRDDDLDNVKAKQREYVVRYVVDNNKVEDMNTDNERQLNKLGNAFWKVAFDFDRSGPGYQGDIVVGAPDCAEIFPDPAGVDIDDCEFIDFSYRMHRMKVYRKFKADLDRLGISLNELCADGNFADTQIYNSQTQDINDDTLQIIEHWFRQPLDGSDTREISIKNPITGKTQTIKQKVEWEAGDIACSIFIGTKEIRYIPKYWEKTGRQNKMYPFVKYCKIPVAKSFWDKSEIAPIKELIDAADREFSMMLLNDAFNANDIIVIEENALADDAETENTPGAHWKTKTGMINGVRRLGGLSSLQGGLKDTINFIRDIIKQTVGNFDVNMGDAPPGNVRTLGGLVELKEQGNKRQNIKKADRKAGFARLYELIDWTALEFYDDNRLIFLGATGETQPDQQEQQEVIPGQNMDRSKGPVIFRFNSDNMRVLDAEMTDATGEAQYYYPRIDAKIDVGDGITNNKAMTLAATENISKMQITPENYKLIQGMVELMNLPNRKDIKQYLEKLFTQRQQPAEPVTQPADDKPNISISYKDLPVDAQVQLLAQIGIESQGGTQQPLQPDLGQDIPLDILPEGMPMATPEMPPEELPGTSALDKILNSLTDEELQMLEENPEIIFEALRGGAVE